MGATFKLVLETQFPLPPPPPPSAHGYGRPRVDIHAAGAATFFKPHVYGEKGFVSQQQFITVTRVRIRVTRFLTNERARRNTRIRLTGGGGYYTERYKQRTRNTCTGGGGTVYSNEGEILFFTRRRLFISRLKNRGVFNGDGVYTVHVRVRTVWRLYIHRTLPCNIITIYFMYVHSIWAHTRIRAHERV